MGIPLKDDDAIEEDSMPFLLMRLSKIVDAPNHHGAGEALKLQDEWRATVTKDIQSPEEKQKAEAHVLALKKRIKLFLKQEESYSSFDAARPWK